MIIEGNRFFKAENPEQLELMLDLANFYVKSYYDNRWWARCLLRFGIRLFNVEVESANRASRELRDVGYDIDLWKERYKNNW